MVFRTSHWMRSLIDIKYFYLGKTGWGGRLLKQCFYSEHFLNIWRWGYKYVFERFKGIYNLEEFWNELTCFWPSNSSISEDSVGAKPRCFKYYHWCLHKFLQRFLITQMKKKKLREETLVKVSLSNLEDKTKIHTGQSSNREASIVHWP